MELNVINYYHYNNCTTGVIGMQNYSVSVALFDFLPVLVSGLGLGLLARGIAFRHAALAPVAWGAALLIPIGGFCKALWKLLIATQMLDIHWLENLLFIAMAPGFVAMAFSLLFGRRAWQRGTPREQASYSLVWLGFWLALPMLIALAAAALRPESRLWFFWLLGVTTIANVTLIVQAIGACRQGGLRWPIACFAYNFVATLSLSSLSRLPPGEATAWIQEGVNFSAQAAFALGAWRLQRRMLETH